MKKSALFLIAILYCLAIFGQSAHKKLVDRRGANNRWDTTGKTLVASEDGKLRIYWWDTEKGGTMRKYAAFAQYHDGKTFKNKMLSGKGYGCYYMAVYSVKRKDDKMLYLVVSASTTGVDDIPEEIQAYTIENGELADTVQAFKTAKKSYNKIVIDYDWRSAYQQKTIHLSESRDKVYIPVINDLNYTGRFLVYVFDGNNYVFDKNAR